MIKVYQTDTSNVSGNCWQAAVASIFDLELEEVPHFMKEYDSYGAYKGWLNYMGYVPFYVTTSDVKTIEAIHLYNDVLPYCLLTVKSFKYSQGNHCVVGYYENNKLNIVHDPNPEYLGKKLEDYEIQMADFYIKCTK